MLRYKTAAEVPQSGITGRGVKPTPLEPEISWSGALSTVALGVQPPDPSSPSTRTMNQKQTDMNYANNSGVLPEKEVKTLSTAKGKSSLVIRNNDNVQYVDERE